MECGVGAGGRGKQRGPAFFVLAFIVHANFGLLSRRRKKTSALRSSAKAVFFGELAWLGIIFLEF
jgi:hypothetical protein